MAKSERWVPLDHACRECGGRIVEVTNAGPTGGGNPVFKCADCGFGSSGMGPSCICWCGMQHRGQSDPQYTCINVNRAKTDPVIEAALMRSGYLSENPRHRPKNQIAIISIDCWAQARKLLETK